jgi:hypothetical protein
MILKLAVICVSEEVIIVVVIIIIIIIEYATDFL